MNNTPQERIIIAAVEIGRRYPDDDPRRIAGFLASDKAQAAINATDEPVIHIIGMYDEY